MSRFFSSRYESLEPYTPGEQPKNLSEVIKLNTNESPYPPLKEAMEYGFNTARPLNLYSDPECVELRTEMAKKYGIKPSQVVAVNGSDEILNFSFMAFCDDRNTAAFPDITYGFYKVFADFNHVRYEEIPLDKDFKVDFRDYLGINKTIFIANPNAPTGLTISLSEIEEILKSNPDNVVIIDEAYVDFGGESAVKLIDTYKNLLVTQTFSKSRSMAGGRLGFGFACEELISDINRIRFSTNPYNVNAMTMAVGVGTLKNDDYYMEKCREIAATRDYTREELIKMGFSVIPSKANFIFAETDRIDGEVLYNRLRERNILTRHFKNERIRNFVRISIGTKEQMARFLLAVKEILEEK
ncbi:MAG: histidinol-phosphate transaminase [Clostridia bacterium]|nr:histidinol-phosphate transaminase [Clostridia bacterium]